MATYHNSVLGCKDGKLIEACDEVPARGDVASYEDAEGQDGEGVHRCLLRRPTHAVDAQGCPWSSRVVVAGKQDAFPVASGGPKTLPVCRCVILYCCDFLGRRLFEFDCAKAGQARTTASYSMCSKCAGVSCPLQLAVLVAELQQWGRR